MFWLVVGFVLTSFGLGMLSFHSDWPGAERDVFFRNAGAASGFIAFLGLLCILYGAWQGAPNAVYVLASALLVGAVFGFVLTRKRKRSASIRDLASMPNTDDTPEVRY